MYNLGQTAKVKATGNAAIIIGTDGDEKNSCFYVFTKTANGTMDTEVLSQNELTEILEKDHRSVNGTRIYKGKFAKKTMSGSFSKKECEAMEDAMIKELESVTKKFLTEKQ